MATQLPLTVSIGTSSSLSQSSNTTTMFILPLNKFPFYSTLAAFLGWGLNQDNVDMRTGTVGVDWGS